MNPLFVLPCTKTKIWDITPVYHGIKVFADNAYRGQLFLKGQALVNSLGKDHVILSAKYGFLLPTDIVENYNETFKTKKPDITFLSSQAREKELDQFDPIIVLGGSTYANVCIKIFKHVYTPLQGLPIGKMFQALGNGVTLEKVQEILRKQLV